MTTDIYSRVLFNDGEGVDPTDFNALGGQMMAILWDQLVATLPSQAKDTPVSPEFNNGIDLTQIPFAIAPTVTSARPSVGSTNTKIKINKGTLMQPIAATATGSEPQFLAFSFDGTTELTIANGDATNPRVDLIQMKLDYVEDTATSRDFKDAVTGAVTTTTPNKRRRVRCTINVKSGTPAVSPTYPTLDAGFVAVAGVVVNATWAGATAPVDTDSSGVAAVLHDLRLPVGVDIEHVGPQSMLRDVSGGSVSTNGVFFDTASQTTTVPVYAIVNPTQGRILQVSAATGVVGTITAQLCRYVLADARVSAGLTPVPVTLGNATNLVVTGAVGPLVFTRRTAKGGQILHLPAAGPTVQFSADAVGPPIWTSGRRQPVDPRGLNSTSQAFESVALVQALTGAGNLTVGPVTFWIARGIC